MLEVPRDSFWRHTWHRDEWSTYFCFWLLQATFSDKVAALVCECSCITAVSKQKRISELLAEQELVSIVLFGRRQQRKNNTSTQFSRMLCYGPVCWMCLYSLAKKNKWSVLNPQLVWPTVAASWLLSQLFHSAFSGEYSVSVWFQWYLAEYPLE